MSDPRETVLVTWPEWVQETVAFGTCYETDEDRMRLAIELARQNVVRGTGGPFGAAIFEQSTGALLSVGVNSVVRLNNSTLHAEMVAIMMAQHRLGSYTLAGSPSATYELVKLVRPVRDVSGRGALERRAPDDHRRRSRRRHGVEFEEGPVFPQSYAYLQERGVAITRSVLRQEAAAVLELYRRQGGQIYNA